MHTFGHIFVIEKIVFEVPGVYGGVGDAHIKGWVWVSDSRLLNSVGIIEYLKNSVIIEYSVAKIRFRNISYTLLIFYRIFFKVPYFIVSN